MQATTDYRLASGTSLASPLVAGAIARYLSVLPDSEVEKLTPEILKARMIDSASRGSINLDTIEHKTTSDRLLYKVSYVIYQLALLLFSFYFARGRWSLSAQISVSSPFRPCVFRPWSCWSYSVLHTRSQPCV